AGAAGATAGSTATGAAGSAAGAARWAWEWTKSIGGAVLLFLVIRTFLIQTFVITSGSMEDTLLVGDFLVLNKAVYGAEVPWVGAQMPGYDTPERGDIIVFRAAHAPGLDLVKRLVGLPGDTLDMRDGVLHLNGVPQGEAYVQHRAPEANQYHPWMAWQHDYLAPGVDAQTYRPTLNDWGPIIVPHDRFFAMGDNRDLSLDSRYWGFVERDKVKGRVLGIYFSFDPGSAKAMPWLQDIRWERLFSGVD
ncbi:MAG: signal peptidase I, partial [Longimicrobiales bacterium]